MPKLSRKKKVPKLYIYSLDGRVPEMGGVRMQSLMASAVAKMVRKKSASFAGLLDSSRFFIHCALLSVADGFM